MHGKKEAIVKGDYCKKYYPLPENKDIRSDITIISGSLFEYIRINETTQICDCLYPEEKEKCYKEFLELD